jgi:hypothetical protein
VFDTRVQRRIFGPKRDEATGEWIKQRNEGLYDMYCSRNVIRVIKSRRLRCVGHVAGMGELCAYGFLVRKPEGKRRLGRPRRRWEDIKVCLQKAGWWGHGLDREPSCSNRMWGISLLADYLLASQEGR